MEYVCDAPPHTWFRFLTEAEAAQEAKEMGHAVDKFFRDMRARAVKAYVPPKAVPYIEQSIGREDHIKSSMPLFLTLRDDTGAPQVTAMLPAGGRDDKTFRPIVVGRANADPYPAFAAAIRRLGEHYGISLPADRCYPYRRT